MAAAIAAMPIAAHAIIMPRVMGSPVFGDELDVELFVVELLELELLVLLSGSGASSGFGFATTS